jgi:ATP-dependent HslUV protease ATP-binding subunit HslU
MIGSTGVGKTEIARRLAKLANSPFIKIEASKFTEVGYVGRDVESLMRDLVDIAVEMVRLEKAAQVEEKAEKHAEERLLDILSPPPKKTRKRGKTIKPTPEQIEEYRKKRDRLRRQLRAGKLDERMVDIEVQERVTPAFEIISGAGFDDMDMGFRDTFPGVSGTRSRKRKMRADEAFDYLVTEEESKLIDMEQVTREALERVEESGIVFLDEIDKIAGRESGHGPEVSREGVQRDILPIVEGTTVSTRYGMVRTDHVLFIAAGAFHVSTPSDLIPELQGRFPIRVEMDALSEEDFVRILQEPKNALLKQYSALLGTENVLLEFSEDAVREIAHFAAVVNESTENIGARRLHTILEAMLEEISFEGANLNQEKLVIDASYVRQQLGHIVKNQDLSRYIL